LHKFVLYFIKILVITLLFSISPGSSSKAWAQSPDSSWTEFINISRTATASTIPCIVADTAGNVHVFWSEDVGGETENILLNPEGTPQLDARGNQINYLTGAGNTLYYTRWDGEAWIEPIDIIINPYGLIEYPSSTVDIHGILHVIWVGSEGANTRLYYSRAVSWKANSAFAWSKPVVLAEPVLFAYYPATVVADSSGGIHILFSQLGTDPGAYILNSYDWGNTWSDPIYLYTTDDPSGNNEGVSTVRLIIDKEDHLHATWTRYDKGGNGKAIYYSQSRDLGKTWSEPFEVAKWQPGWYEVDWLNVGVVGDEIHLVWEGSSNVATQVERFSYDSGLTWSEPNYILPNIVGENGFANLVVDSANQLHLLVVKRGDGYTLSHGIWYTSWEGNHWRDPILLGTTISSIYSMASNFDEHALSSLLRGTFTGNGLRYQEATIVNGNELFVIVVNEWDGEIWSSHTTLSSPFVLPRPYPQPTSTPTSTPTFISQFVNTSTPIPDYQFNGFPSNKGTNTGTLLLLGILPVLLLVVGLITYERIFKRS
jgi:hypothetical protein